MPETITSAANPLVKRLRRLAERKHRRREGAFVVEGVQPVSRAVEQGARVQTLVVAPELLANRPTARMVDEQERAGVPVARLSRELFLRLSEREGPSGLAAIVRSRMLSVEELTTAPDAVFVALHQIGNPGNLGTIIRAADAAGAAGVILIGDGCDPFAPSAVKASMGSLFAVDIAHADGTDAFFDWARARGIQVVAASGRAREEHWSAGYAPPLTLLFGSEGPGLPEESIQRSDLRVRIPMVGTAESLNLSVAAGIVLYEARREALLDASWAGAAADPGCSHRPQRGGHPPRAGPFTRRVRPRRPRWNEARLRKPVHPTAWPRRSPSEPAPGTARPRTRGGDVRSSPPCPPRVGGPCTQNPPARDQGLPASRSHRTGRSTGRRSPPGHGARVPPPPG